MTDLLEKKLANSLGNIEAAITNIAPEAFELAVRSTFLKSASGLLSAGVFAVIAVVGIYAMIRIMPEKGLGNELPRGACVLGVIAVGLVASIVISAELSASLPGLIDPAAMTARAMISAALK